MPKIKTTLKKGKKAIKATKPTSSSISVRKKVAAERYDYLKNTLENKSLLQRIQSELKFNMSYVNLILGLLIIVIAGILLFNYFKKSQVNLGPAQNTISTEQAQKDVTIANLPGKYTVKEGDTLFKIAQNYYKDGYKFSRIAETNKLVSADLIAVGQVLEIPKAEAENATSLGTGGAENGTIWGDKITGDSYTVVEGDWLSTIAGRAYGDIMAFDKIAKANNIADPNVIEPGTILNLPR